MKRTQRLGEKTNLQSFYPLVMAHWASAKPLCGSAEEELSASKILLHKSVNIVQRWLNKNLPWTSSFSASFACSDVYLGKLSSAQHVVKFNQWLPLNPFQNVRRLIKSPKTRPLKTHRTQSHVNVHGPLNSRNFLTTSLLHALFSTLS